MARRNRYAHPATIARMVRNIRAVYARATADEQTAGRAWYRVASHGCNVWAVEFNVHSYTVASVIAALSPQVEWQSNLRHALNLISGARATVLGASRPLQANVRKAERILSDGAYLPDAYFIEGHKVRNFARNLQGNTKAVTVDTHASQIALGTPETDARIGLLSAYACFVKAYQRAAELEGIEPCEIQAITWLTWKRLYPAGRKRAIRRDAGQVGKHGARKVA
jgi:hypothetical protein